MAEINISGLDKAQLLIALYERAMPYQLGFTVYDARPMGGEEASALLAAAGPGLLFRNIKGRNLNVTLGGETLATDRYNKDNGPGAAEEVVEALRRGLPPPERDQSQDRAMALRYLAAAEHLIKDLEDPNNVDLRIAAMLEERLNCNFNKPDLVKDPTEKPRRPPQRGGR